MKDQIIIDAHCHVFNYDCVPEVFQTRYLKAFNPKYLKAFLTVFNNWLDEDDVFDRARKLLKIAMKCNLVQIAEALLTESREIAATHQVIFIPLMMDFEYGMGPASASNKPPDKNFKDQANETAQVARRYPGVFLPFIAADPRRIKQYKDAGDPQDPHGIRYLTDALENNGFWGVKIYPPLGYYPDDPYLMPLYDYCQAHQIPVTAHCSFGGGYSNEEVPPGAADSKKKTYYRKMANPTGWRKVLNKYPELKLNLGHFGGDIYERFMGVLWKDKKQIRIERRWRKTAVRLMNDFDNVYADISFHSAIFYDSEQYFAQMKQHVEVDNIGKKILFGSDWWVNRTMVSEKQYIEQFCNLSRQFNISDKDLTSIMSANAIKFLGLDQPDQGPLNNYNRFVRAHNLRFPDWFQAAFLS